MDYAYISEKMGGAQSPAFNASEKVVGHDKTVLIGDAGLRKFPQGRHSTSQVE